MIKYITGSQNSKPNLLFIHGMCHGAWCWDQGFMQSFAQEGFNCYAIDLPGHEKPGKNPGINRFSIQDYVEAVHKTVFEIGRETVLIGHSMGGFVVQKYLEQYEYCKAAVLMASVPYSGLLKGSLRYLSRHPLASLNLISRDIYGPFVKHSKELYYQDTASDRIVSYQSLMRAESYKALIQMMFQPVKQPKPKTVPMLCLGAAEDTVITPAEVKKTAAFHEADIAILKSFGHNLMLDEKHAAVSEQMLKWFDFRLCVS